MYRVGSEEIEELKKVIETKSLFKVNSGLQETFKVQEKLEKIFGSKYSIFLTSGQAALNSALIASGIGPGDEVIVPAYTYIATAMAVVNAGAIPVLAEVDETLTISPEDIESKITPHTKGIIPVHIQGFPCNMNRIMDIANKHNLFVLEDACQAVGGSFNGKRLGAIGHAGALSFNYFKIISSGEGGAIFTNDRNIYERSLIHHDASAVSFFGNQMSDFKNKDFCGTEYRSNELCAAMMNIQLDRLDSILYDLRKNKKYIMESLKDVCDFVSSYDIDGDCGVVIPFKFESEEKARAFAEKAQMGGCLPIDTGRHVYTNWTPIVEKRGAYNPLMDPFKMEANKEILRDYTPNTCPETLKKLSQVLYINVNPDWTKSEMDEKIAAFKNAAKDVM